MCSHTKIQLFREQRAPGKAPHKPGGGGRSSLQVLQEQQQYSVHADGSHASSPALSGRGGSGGGGSLPLHKLAAAEFGDERRPTLSIIKVGTD